MKEELDTADVVPEPEPGPAPKQKKGKHTAEPTPASTFDVEFLTNQLSSLPLEALTYEDCGLLLNSLSAASTAVGGERRRKQEQLEAGSQKSPCTTCGRMVDISKPGAFQILSRRDKHFQSYNAYFCSQTCVLAENMPSHRVKKLPGDAGAKT